MSSDRCLDHISCLLVPIVSKFVESACASSYFYIKLNVLKVEIYLQQSHCFLEENRNNCSDHLKKKPPHHSPLDFAKVISKKNLKKKSI